MPSVHLLSNSFHTAFVNVVSSIQVRPIYCPAGVVATQRQRDSLAPNSYSIPQDQVREEYGVWLTTRPDYLNRPLRLRTSTQGQTCLSTLLVLRNRDHSKLSQVWIVELANSTTLVLIIP